MDRKKGVEGEEKTGDKIKNKRKEEKYCRK
jgi:hypothetical protein